MTENPTSKQKVVRKKSFIRYESYRIGNENGVGVRRMIKSADADSLSETVSVNG